MEKADVYHITHTDPRYDGRVLKQMESHQRYLKGGVLGFGIYVSEDAVMTNEVNEGIKFRIAKLRTKRFGFLPRALRYGFMMIEFTLKAFIIGCRCRPNFVQCHDTLALPTGYLLAALFDCKLIYDAHELESKKGGQNRLLSAITIMIERFAWKKIDALIVVSEEIGEWYIHKYGPKKTYTIYNSPPRSFNDNNKSAQSWDKKFKNYFRKKYNLDENIKIFLYIGVITAGRGIEKFLNAFQREGDGCAFILLGYGYEEYVSNIRFRIKDISNVFIHEPVAHEEVVNLAQSADFGLCLIEDMSLSDYLSLPNKLFEYANAGIPILAADNPAMKRIIDLYNIGYITINDEKHIAESLRELKRDAKHYRNYLIPYELTWNAQSKKIEIMLSQLMNT